MKDILKALHERPIAYYPIYKRITGSTTAGILLSQLMYWWAKVDGRTFYKTDADIYEETALTERELKTAKAHLRQFDFVRIFLAGNPARTHYEIFEDKLLAQIRQTSLDDSSKQDRTNQPNKEGRIVQTLIQENTQKNKSERAPAQILVTQYSLETIPAPAKPRTKVSDIQRNPNAYNEAAAYLLTAMKELGATDFPGKFAVPYFLYEMKKSRWVSLILPESPEEHHAWIGTHGAGVRQWAINERKFYPAQAAGTPTTPSYSNYKPKE